MRQIRLKRGFGILGSVLALAIVLAAVGLGWAESAPPDAAKSAPKEPAKVPAFAPSDSATWDKLSDKEQSLMAGVKDNSVGYEEEALYWLANQVAGIDAGLMKPDAKALTYSALFAQPAAYRGTPVTLRGTLEAVEPFTVLDEHLKKNSPILYRCTLREPGGDGDASEATVLAFEDPQKSLKLKAAVIVKGYFYKIRRYESKKGAAFAPLLIAKRLDADETTAVKGPETGTPPAKSPSITELPTTPMAVFTTYDKLPWDELLSKEQALLEDVKDNIYGYDERAFWWMVALVNRLPAEKLTPGADDLDLAYKRLMEQPSAYRGKPVTLSGVYMSVAPFRTVADAQRESGPVLYECTIREPPMDQKGPIATIITFEDPMKSLKVFDQVRVKGYFYKVRKYEGTQGIGEAPLLIAKQLQPVGDAGPAKGTGSQFPFDPTFIMMIVVIGGMLVGFFFIKQKLRGKSSNASGKHPVVIHKFRLHRPDSPPPAGGSGPASEGGSPKP
jgi:hypothetical protein